METRNKRAIGYVRRSTADLNNTGDVSREVQEKAIGDLAKRDGFTGKIEFFVDWGRSADETKESKRTQFLAMLEEMEKGRVDVVYAYATDRLYRSMRTFMRLQDAANKHGVRVVTQRDGVLGGDGGPMAQAFAKVGAVFAELELNTAKARAQSAARARKERGDHMGVAPTGWRLEGGKLVQVESEQAALRRMAAAFAETGSFIGTARTLNAEKVPTKHGGDARWTNSTVANIMRREFPELVPPRVRKGAYAVARSRFAGLLVCHCGHIMTGSAPGYRRTTTYKCPVAYLQANHPYPRTITESQVLPWIREEVGHLRRIRVKPRGDDKRAEELQAERAFFMRQAARGKLTEDQLDAEIDRIDAELEQLSPVVPAVDVPPVDWRKPAAHINRMLSLILKSVQLDKRLLPVSAKWVHPYLRDDAPAPTPPAAVPSDDRRLQTMALADEGMRPREIANELGVNYFTVCRWLRERAVTVVPTTRKWATADPRMATALDLYDGGMPPRQIAEHVGASVSGVYKWIAKRNGKAASGRGRRASAA